VRGEHVDARCDVFALGCVLYELLTGKKAFDAESLHSVLYKVMQAEPRPAREVAPDLAVPLSQVLEKAMAKDVARRFPDAGAFLVGLDHAREAIASGRGDEPLAELVLSPPSPASKPPASPSSGAAPPPIPPRAGPPGSSVRSVDRGPAPASRGSAPRVAGRPSSRPSMQSLSSPRSRLPIMAALGLVFLLLVGVGFVVVRNLSAPPAPSAPAGQPGKLDELVRQAVETQVELAQKRFDAGDYRDAYQRSERVLKLDPTNETAKKVFAEAREIKEKVDEGTKQAREALAAGDRAKAGDGYWTLLLADPDDSAARELASDLDGGFEARAAEARKLMEASRAAAAKSPSAARLDSFKQADGMAQDADASLRSRKYAAAARDFLRARQRFDRSARGSR
jgi:hypothetical protein